MSKIRIINMIIIALLFSINILQAEKSHIVNNQINNKKVDKFEYEHKFYREKEIINDKGEVNIKREYVTQTISGETLLGVATYKYIHFESADEAVFTLPLPKQVTYKKGSATNEEFLWFSSDNGKTWLQFKDLKITQSDDITQETVSTNEITHLQWRIKNNLSKGDTGKLEYKIIVR